jgi:hypothetical protein
MAGCFCEVMKKNNTVVVLFFLGAVFFCFFVSGGIGIFVAYLPQTP